MRVVADLGPEVAWLESRAADPREVTGYDCTGWETSAWILHAMYEHPRFPPGVTHDDVHRSRLARGLAEPAVTGGVSLDEVSAVTGIPLGFAPAPGPPWRRLLWSEYLSRAGETGSGPRLLLPPDRQVPCASGTWPAGIRPPSEGSLDEASLDALLDVLAAHSSGGQEAGCLAFRHAAITRDYRPVLLGGPLRSLRALISDELVEGRKTACSAPFNFWPRDRSWFALTDYDACGTKISGPRSLIDAILADADLEAVPRNAAETGDPAGHEGHDR